jgi:hypothetical protein
MSQAFFISSMKHPSCRLANVIRCLSAAGGEPLMQVRGAASKSMTATFISEAPRSKFHPCDMGHTASRAFGTVLLLCL